MSTVVLVACSKLKLPTAAPARELYCSPLFQLSRKFAEQRAPHHWRILSARHGHIPPDWKIAPYNEALTDMPKAERKMWANKVGPNLGRELLAVRCQVLWVLAGIHYREFLLPILADYIDEKSFRIPMVGMAIGQQKRWLIRALEEGRP